MMIYKINENENENENETKLDIYSKTTCFEKGLYTPKGDFLIFYKNDKFLRLLDLQQSENT